MSTVIMVVDDEPDIVTLLRFTLEQDGHAVVRSAFGGQHEDGDGARACVLAQALEHRIAVHDGHHHIEDHETRRHGGFVARLDARLGKSLGAVVSGYDHMPVFFEHEFNEGDDIALVVDEQYPRHDADSIKYPVPMKPVRRSLR